MRPGDAARTEKISEGIEMSSAAQTAVLPAVAQDELFLPAFTLWWREVVRFYRQKSRVVGVIASPVLFWVVIGSGFGNSLRPGASGESQPFLNYFYPGALIMIVLFTSIFTMMSVIEDRKEGFLLSVLVAPVSRSAIVLGKVMGGTTLSTIQGLIFLVFAPLVGVHTGRGQVSVGGADGLSGFVCADGAWISPSPGQWIPTKPSTPSSIFFSSRCGCFPALCFHCRGASPWLRVLMEINPLTYGVQALRALLYPASQGRLFTDGLDGDAGTVFACLCSDSPS